MAKFQSLQMQPRAHSTCSWGWQAHWLSTCCVSETSSLIFYHYCEAATKEISFKYQPDSIISICKTLQGLFPWSQSQNPDNDLQNPACSTTSPFPSAPPLPQFTAPQPHWPPGSSIEVLRVLSLLSLCSCCSLCLQFSSFRPAVFHKGTVSPPTPPDSQGTLDTIWRHFWLLTVRECSWHLVSRGHGSF